MSTRTDPTTTEPTSKLLKTGRRQQLALLLALSVVAAACGSSTASSAGSDDESTAEQSEVGSELDTTEDTSGDSTPESSESSTTSVAEPEPTTTSTSTESEEVGSALDFFPPFGTPFSVVGVHWDDDLNFRSAPGTSNPVLDTAISLDIDHSIKGLGEAWQFDDSIWWKVSIDGTEAWASQRFLAALGQTNDIFDEVAADLGILKAANMADLAHMVADTRGTGEPKPRVIIVGEPLAFEGVGGIVTVDVLGFGDDSLKGERLRITAALVYEDEESDEPIVDFVVLEGVERTILCQRGVNEGLCL